MNPISDGVNLVKADIIKEAEDFFNLKEKIYNLEEYANLNDGII